VEVAVISTSNPVFTHAEEINAQDQSCGTQKSLYVRLNIFPFALKVHPRRSRHLSNNLGLFFNSSKADATTSALGISRSVAT
jgi:hypothetical protein